ncbi:hypothetical protein [Sulfurisphaera ohwakuensis]|uniref:DUF8155 domain-containing protein n=1 Tax=Sulfurisphaera ohwakuensis TaxID=69656 RepID=A0A650CIM7_SULOH|nr:hypothetical protein [Sulfurisphaera ohwakuensis]MBB5254578.1 hypothetical protein [Sulfurisphaera ohwakuensis]QGR17588.1 hypothetical protein D1869_10615 [Sulfurisphaera ohwakuensis]
MKILKGSLLSFFSSGFPSHVKIKAIDLSSPDQENFYSPFSGIIEKIEKVKIGRPNKYTKIDYDVVMYINSNGKRIKVLHVEPYLEEGSEIKEGEKIGKFLESPYTAGDFKHAHIEGITFKFPSIKRYISSSVGQVISVEKDYFDVRILDYSEAGNYYGLGCCGGLLNTSFPFGCYGGIIGDWDGSLSFLDFNLGYPYKVKRKNVIMFEGKKGLIRNWEFEASFKVLSNKPICGSSFIEVVLGYNTPPMIRVFRKPIFKEGEEIKLEDLKKMI